MQLRVISYLQSKPQDSWDLKYKRRGKGIPLDLLRSYGRQILEVIHMNTRLCIITSMSSEHTKL